MRRFGLIIEGMMKTVFQPREIEDGKEVNWIWEQAIHRREKAESRKKID